MAEPDQNQAPEGQAPDVAPTPPPSHLGDLGYTLLALAWAVVVIGVGMWIQSR